jgi:hypothetical protein
MLGRAVTPPANAERLEKLLMTRSATAFRKSGLSSA